MKRRILKRGGRSKYFNEPPHEVIQRTHHELLLEVQYKYPGLYNLSQKYGHELLDVIAKIIFDRVKSIMGVHIETRGNCFKLSGHYRKLHPHFGDFQMILTTLQSLQASVPENRRGGVVALRKKGLVTDDLYISDLSKVTYIKKAIYNIPIESVKAAYSKYSDRIFKVMSEHIKSLDSKIVDGDTEEVIAKKKVREELRKMLPYMPTIVKQVVTKHITSQDSPMHKIRIYGEPFLPSKDAMSPFVHRYHSGTNQSRIIRHPRMFNLLLFKIPHQQYAELMAMDGTIINGAKLVIRSDNPVYTSTPELRSEMSAALGGPTGGIIPTADNIEEDLDKDGDLEMK